MIRSDVINDPAEANQAFSQYKQEVYRLFDTADAISDLTEAAMLAMSSSLSTLVASLRESSNGVYQGAHEISSGSQRLSERTAQQSATLKETASSMEQMTTTIAKNSETTRRADELATTALGSAGKSRDDIKQTVVSMLDVASASDEN